MIENKHTPEPWNLCEVTNETGRIKHFVPVDSEKLSLLTIVENAQGIFAATYNDADARRIVACVNACAGLETEMLEALVMDGTTLQNIMRRGLICLEQRDDLLKALEDIAWTRGLNERPSKLVEQLERKALIAIAKIKEAE